MGESQSTSSPSGVLRAAGAVRGPRLHLTFDGVPIAAYAGESVAAALLASGIRTLRRSPRDAQPRGAFCWMGSCQECIVMVEGVRRPGCRVEVRDGLCVMPVTAA